MIGDLMYDLLDSLKDGRGMTVRELAEDTGRARNAIYRSLQSMAYHGYVKRQATKPIAYAITTEGIVVYHNERDEDRDGRAQDRVRTVQQIEYLAAHLVTLCDDDDLYASDYASMITDACKDVRQWLRDDFRLYE